MSAIVARGHWRTTALTLAVVLALLVAGMASGGLRALIDEAADKIGPLAVAATLPAQIAAILLCSAALWVLRPGVGFWGCLNSRLLRDAGDNLLKLLVQTGHLNGKRIIIVLDAFKLAQAFDNLVHRPPHDDNAQVRRK